MSKKHIVLILIIGIVFQSCIGKRLSITDEHARKEVNMIIEADTIEYEGKLLSKYKTLRIAKNKVYKTYGYWNIVWHQKPYRKYYIDRYLFLSGTLPLNWKGGTFTIIVDRKDGEIEYLIHGK